MELTAEQDAVRCGDCAECTVSVRMACTLQERMARAQELFA